MLTDRLSCSNTAQLRRGACYDNSRHLRYCTHTHTHTHTRETQVLTMRSPDVPSSCSCRRSFWATSQLFTTAPSAAAARPSGSGEAIAAAACCCSAYTSLSALDCLVWAQSTALAMEGRAVAPALACCSSWDELPDVSCKCKAILYAKRVSCQVWPPCHRQGQLGGWSIKL